MNEAPPKPRVIAIDGEQEQLTALSRMLSPLYNVKVATSGKEGLRLAEEDGADIILLGLFVGDMSSFDVLLALKRMEKTKHVPVIFITGNETSGDNEEKGLALGAVDYIRGPFSDTAVNLRIRTHLQLSNQMKNIGTYSLTDPLTGLSNQRGFDLFAKAMWSSAVRANESFSLLLVDVDKFKAFNKSFGYLSGDTCLKTVASTLQRLAERGSDCAFRWEGDEFALLLPGTPIEGAMHVAERILAGIASTPVHLPNEITFITASIGAGAVTPGRSRFDEVFPKFVESVATAKVRAMKNGCNRIERA